MSVITISRQIGSGGSEIGKKAASNLGYHLIDKKTLEKVFSDYGFVNFGSIYDTKPGLWERYDTMHNDLTDFLQRVILGIAHHGNVIIVGRGSFAVLQQFDNVLNVRIRAPFEDRVRKVMMEQDMDDQHAAERMVRDNDRLRRSFVSSYFHVDNEDPANFDLILDTGKLPVDVAVTLITDAAKAIESGIDEEKGFVKTVTVDVDEILSQEIEKVLVS